MVQISISLNLFVSKNKIESKSLTNFVHVCISQNANLICRCINNLNTLSTSSKILGYLCGKQYC